MAVSDAEIEAKILELLDAREGTICPSDAARALAEDWRPLMDPVRAWRAAWTRSRSPRRAVSSIPTRPVGRSGYDCAG